MPAWSKAVVILRKTSPAVMAGRLAAMLEGTPVAAALAQLGRQSTPDVRLESQLAPDRARIGSCPRPAGAVAPLSFSSGSVPASPALPESCQRSAHCDRSTRREGVRFAYAGETLGPPR